MSFQIIFLSFPISLTYFAPRRLFIGKPSSCGRVSANANGLFYLQALNLESPELLESVREWTIFEYSILDWDQLAGGISLKRDKCDLHSKRLPYKPPLQASSSPIARIQLWPINQARQCACEHSVKQAKWLCFRLLYFLNYFL